MNMSTYKRVDQMAHLKQKRISDDSCRAIVIDTIMESVRPLTKAELAEEISALFHILISPTRLNDVISDLLGDGIILFSKSDYIEISPDKEYDFLSAKLSEEQLRENATKLWLSDLRLSKDIPDNLGLYLAQALPIFLRTLFIKHGVSSYELLTSRKDQAAFNLSQISKDVAAQFEKSSQADIEFYLPTIFQSTKHAEIIEYLKHGIDKAVGYICEVISDENLSELTSELRNLTIYLDTNTIYRLLNLQGTTRYESIRETVDFCNKYGVKLKVSALTKRELSLRLKYDSKVLIQFPTKTNWVKAGYKYRTTDNYVSTYWAQAMKSRVSVEDFIAYYQNFDLLLAEDQIEIENIEVDEESLISKATSIYEKMSLADPYHEKSEFGLWHDAYNFAYVQKMQKPGARNAIDARCLFLTTDQALTSFQRETHEFKDCPPIVIAPSQLLQLFSFSKPDSGFEETFIKFFASSSLGTSFAYGNDDIQEILSRIEHYHGVNPEVAERVLCRELVNSRYSNAETEEEKEEIIYNSISEELLEELNLTKAKVEMLKSRGEQLSKDNKAALDLIDENEKQFSSEIEHYQKEISKSTKQLENEVIARHKAEESISEIQKYSACQEELYVNEKWNTWRMRHLWMFWGSLFLCIAIIVMTLVMYCRTKDSGYFGLLALLAIPGLTFPFACRVFSAGVKSETRQKFLEDYRIRLK